MNYYHHLLQAQDRQRDAQREREQRELAAEARAGRPSKRALRLRNWFQFSLPRRQVQEPPCSTCPEYA